MKITYEVALEEGADAKNVSKNIRVLLSALKGVGEARLLEYSIPVEPPSEQKVDAPPYKPPPPTPPAEKKAHLQQDLGRALGFTGDMCGRCGQFTMRRNGSCLVCVSCGTTTGCS